MSRRVDNIPLSKEPPCWGSGELALLPVSLRTVLHGVPILGVSVKKKKLDVSLTMFATPNWRSHIGTVTVDDASLTLVDVIVSVIRTLLINDPDRLDVPILSTPLDRIDNALSIPFEVRTWDFLSRAGIKLAQDVWTLLTGTFREICERLGDVRAALDFSVTASTWIIEDDKGLFGFALPDVPDTLAAAGELLRLRVFRCRGLSPTSMHYTAHFAEVMGKRWSVGTIKPWTLQQCGDTFGLSRERVRQLEQMPLWECAPRVWGQPQILEDLYSQLIDVGVSEVVASSTGEMMDRGSAVALLVGFNYAPEDFKGPRTVADEVGLHGIKWSELLRTAYHESEKLGLMSLFELRHHIAESFPVLIGKKFDDVIEALVVYDDLPHGYVYVENRTSSWLKGWFRKLFSVLGPQSFEETYKALERFCKVRIPRLVFPPRSVIRAFIERESSLWLLDDVVGLQEPVQQLLEGVEEWVRDQIMGCTGHVIHKTQLWDLARSSGVKGGTLNVYTKYSLLFKPCGRGCVTMTGIQPSPVSIELAGIRASAIRVSTRRGKVNVADGVVSVVVEVGNDLLDTGVFTTTQEMRKMLQNQNFQIVTGGQQYGSVGWSKNLMTGFTTAFQVLGTQPGDQLEFRFSVAGNEAVVAFVTE